MSGEADNDISLKESQGYIKRFGIFSVLGKCLKPQKQGKLPKRSLRKRVPNSKHDPASLLKREIREGGPPKPIASKCLIC